MTHQPLRIIGYTLPFFLLFCLFSRGALAQPQGEEALPEVIISNNAFSITAYGNQIVDQDYGLYITDRNQIARYDANRNVLLNMVMPPKPVGFFLPLGMALGPDGNLYVSSRQRIYRFNATTGVFIDEFIPKVRGLASSTLGLLFGPDGNLYISSFNTDEVLRYDGVTGAFIDAFVSTGAGGLDYPQAIAFGPDGHLFVCGVGNRAVLKYDGNTGIFIDVFIEEDCGSESMPRSIGFDAADNLYIIKPGSVAIDGSMTDNLVLRFNGQTGDLIGPFIQENAIAGGNGFSTFTFDSSGRFFLRNGARLQRHDALTGSLTRMLIDVPQALLSTGLAHDTKPRILFGPDNDLYVLDHKGISRYNGNSGAYIDLIIAGVGYQDFAIAPDGNLFLSRRGENTVHRYNNIGEYIGSLPTGSNILESPTYLDYGPDNTLFVATDRNGIFRLDGHTGEITGKVPGSGLSGAGHNFAFGPDSTIYLAYGTDKIFIRDIITSGILNTIVNPSREANIQFTALAIGPDNHLYTIVNGTRVERYKQETGNFVGTVASNGLGDPFSLTDYAFGDDGSLFVLDAGSKQVLRFPIDNPSSVYNDTEAPTASFSVLQNYPNPFNSRTSVSYFISQNENVTVEIFDILGRRIELLTDDIQHKGIHTITWQPSATLASGLYLLRVTVDNNAQSIQMIKH